MKTFIATIKDKKLEWHSDAHRAMFMDFLSQNNGKKVRIELEKNPVSNELRGYYYACVVPTCKSVIPEWKNMSNDDIHEMLKKAFNSFDCFNPITQRIERFGRSAMSDNSNTQRAMEFIEKIRLWLAEDYMKELPQPDEYKALRDSAPLK
jgi:hypothetical protein